MLGRQAISRCRWEVRGVFGMEASKLELQVQHLAGDHSLASASRRAASINVSEG